MPKLFDYREYNSSELKRRIGRMSQIAGISSFQFADGRAKDVRALGINTGSGLEFIVLVDRSMDIYSVNYKGIPIAWQSLAGIVSPNFYEPEGSGWLRSWSGGLMTTCGFEQVGTACVDEGVSYGLHGRSGNIPAENVTVEEYWEGDRYIMVARGKILQSYFITENYLLTREISTELGKPIIRVHDHVVNPGYAVTPFEFLYHINFGFPVVDEGARLIFPSKNIIPRDEVAAAGLADWDKICAPVANYQEQVLEHEMIPDHDGFVNAAIVNEKIGEGLGVLVRYDYTAFPFFSEWKQMGEGIYSLGFEPGNCHPHGRKKERERGTLQFLEPGESKDFYLEFQILDGSAAIKNTESLITDVRNSQPS
jgi:hypothetical protein